MGYICSICNQVVHGNGNSLLWHIRNRHALEVGHTFTCPVTCGQHGCLQTFRYSVAFKRHIENKHNNYVPNESDSEGDADEDINNFNNPNNDPPAPGIQSPDVDGVLCN